MELKAYYRDLNLEPGARRDEVILTYRRLMLQWHPDRFPRANDPEAKRKYRAIVAAYCAVVKGAPAKPHLYLRSKTRNASDASSASMPFRFDQKPRQPISLTFAPAVAPSAEFVLRRETLALPNAPESRPDRPIVSTIVIAAMLIVSLITGFNFARGDGQRKTPELAATTSAPFQKPIERAPNIESSPAQTVVIPGRILARSNRAGTNIELVSYKGTERLQMNKRSANTFELPDLLPGDYRLTAHAEGWPDISQVVSVTAEKDTEILLDFKGGALRLESDPTNAVVRIGAKIFGRTPIVISDIAPGRQIFSLQYESWPQMQFTAKITEGAETKEAVRIPYGRLTIESTPKGALLVVDGEEIGRTPLTIAQISAGKRQLRLTADNYEAYDVSISIDDRAELKIHPALTSNVALLDPDNLLKLTWLTKQSNARDYDVAPNFDKIDAFRPKNGVVRNLDRQKLFTNWLGRPFRYSGAVKVFDPKTGRVEFAEQAGEKSKFRVSAQLAPDAKNDESVTNRLQKGAIVELWGTLDAVEEPRWPSKIISIEFTGAKPVR